MYNDHTTILIKYRQKVTQKPFQITIHAKEILKVEIPVDVYSGDVIILENNNFQNCRIPETLTTYFKIRICLYRNSKSHRSRSNDCDFRTHQNNSIPRLYKRKLPSFSH